MGTSYIHTSPDRDENQYWVVACNSSGCSEIDSSTPARLNGPAMPEGVICDRSEVIPGSPSVPGRKRFLGWAGCADQLGALSRGDTYLLQHPLQSAESGGGLAASIFSPRT